jgi:hypothetical protein
MPALNYQVFTLGATPTLIFSGRGRLTCLGGSLCDAAGTITWSLTTPLTLELREDTDVYAKGTIHVIATPW